MKRLLTVVVFMAMVSAAHAEYKDGVKDQVGAVVTDYYGQEKGNKVTEYSIRGLLQKLERVMVDNYIAPKETVPKPTKTKPETPKED
jgi:hypothetical protein